MLNRFHRVVVAAIVVVAPFATAASASSTTTVVAPTAIGYDISFPQCGGSLPAPAGFAVIGVNDGRPFTANPCLAVELRWAESSLSAVPSFYVNTADPGPVGNADWPQTQQSPQICTGANSAPCSYDYGWNAAQNSFQDAVAAETLLGAAAPAAAASSVPWWLDVESGNSWETIRTGSAPTSVQFANDLAVVEGEVAYFASVGASNVGIYSTTSQWTGLVGPTGSTFAANDVWIPGYATLAAAQAGCAASSFTGGRVAMIQYPSNGLDGDLQCPLLSGPSSATVPVSSSGAFTDQLSVAGESAPVSYAQSSGSPYLSVSPTGLVSTSGTRAAGVYTATGTSGAGGVTGTFTFALTVGLLTQSPPTSGSVSVGASATFTDQLTVTGASGALTYVETSGSPSLVVSPTGLLTTSGALARGTYVARGTVRDTSGDTGTFSFRLVVGTLTESSADRSTITTATSATFTDQLTVTGASGAVTYVETSGSPSLVVSPTGLLTTSGALTPGTYATTGTMTDAAGDTGTFHVTVSVGPNSPTPKVIAPVATRVIGHVVAGRTVVVRIVGSGFVGRPLVRSHPGTSALVVADTGTVLTVRVTAARHSRNGIYTFTITVAGGKVCSVRYVQR